MNVGTMYKIHKWIAVTAGIFLLTWLISGIAMILPPAASESNEVVRVADYGSATVSPAQAIAILTKSGDQAPRVTRVQLRRIYDRIVYDIVMEAGGYHLVDAQSGSPFTISPALANELIRWKYRLDDDPSTIKRIDGHDGNYPWGTLPAYRIIYDKNPGVTYHVSIRDGTVQRSDWWQRLKNTLSSLHTFQPVKLFTTRDAARKGLLLLVGIIGIATALTGYYLAIRRA